MLSVCEEALAALNGVLDPALARCKRLAVQPDATVAVKLEFRSGAMRRGAVEAAVRGRAALHNIRAAPPPHMNVQDFVSISVTLMGAQDSGQVACPRVR